MVFCGTCNNVQRLTFYFFGFLQFSSKQGNLIDEVSSCNLTTEVYHAYTLKPRIDAPPDYFLPEAHSRPLLLQPSPTY